MVRVVFYFRFGMSSVQLDLVIFGYFCVPVVDNVICMDSRAG